MLASKKKNIWLKYSSFMNRLISSGHTIYFQKEEDYVINITQVKSETKTLYAEGMEIEHRDYILYSGFTKVVITEDIVDLPYTQLKKYFLEKFRVVPKELTLEQAWIRRLY